jgi:hypothetical protein
LNLLSQYVVAGDAVVGGMRAREHGVVGGVVHAKNADGTKQAEPRLDIGKAPQPAEPSIL